MTWNWTCAKIHLNTPKPLIDTWAMPILQISLFSSQHVYCSCNNKSHVHASNSHVLMHKVWTMHYAHLPPAEILLDRVLDDVSTVACMVQTTYEFALLEILRPVSNTSFHTWPIQDLKAMPRRKIPAIKAVLVTHGCGVQQVTHPQQRLIRIWLSPDTYKALRVHMH